MAERPHAALEADRLASAIDVAAAAGAAAGDAGVGVELLAGFPEAAVHAARIHGRLEAAALERCTRAGREAAEAGVRLAALVDLYLSTAWRLQQGVRDAAGRDADTAAEVAVSLARAADDAVAAVCGGFEAAKRQAVRQQEAQRREFVDELLAGSADAQRLERMGASFGFNPSRSHLVVIARTDRPLMDAGPVQGRLEREVLSRVGEHDVLVATKDGDLVCVFPGDLADPAPGLLALLQEAEDGPWRLATGDVWSGPGGVARSYRDAVEVLSISSVLQPDAAISRAEEWEAHRLLLRDREAFQRMSLRVLDGLTSARGGAEPLVQTLEAYFLESGNVTAMARRLHLSPRAVTYRLGTINRLTGLSPQVPTERLTLEVATIGYRLAEG